MSNEVESHSWWQRPAGGREIMQVALPLVVSSLSWTVMTFVDRMMLKWDSGEAMAAAFSASTLWFAVLCLPLGICMYCSTFVSQYFGNRQFEKIGSAVWQGVWVAVIFSPLLLCAIPLAPKIFTWAAHESQVYEFEVLYFRILCFGMPAMLIAQALSSFYAGQGKTRVIMVVDAFVAVVNLVLDYFWIFGKAGFPAMGIAGAGWATVAALHLKALIYLILILQPKHRHRFGILRGIYWRRSIFGRLLYYGAPSGFQIVLDVAGFTFFVMLIGRLGAVQAEATSMAFSISTLAFMPIWGFAQAVTIIVGQRLGENDPDQAAQATWSALWITLAYMAFISILYLAVPNLFLFGFFAGEGVSSNQSLVRQTAINLLRFVAAYNLLDATLMVFVSAIKGAGDTPFVLRISLVMSTCLAVITYLGVEIWKFGIYGCWAIITCWVWILGLIYFFRFMQGKWKSMRVIEQIPIVEVESPKVQTAN